MEGKARSADADKDGSSFYLTADSYDQETTTPTRYFVHLDMMSDSLDQWDTEKREVLETIKRIILGDAKGASGHADFVRAVLGDNGKQCWYCKKWLTTIIPCRHNEMKCS